MQHKVETMSVEPLSDDNWNDISSFLPKKDLINLSMISKGPRLFFKPILDEHKKMNQFLRHVVRAEYDAIEMILKEDPSLMLKRGFVTDEAGRTFEDISGLEYAIWAQAIHILACMLDSLSTDTKSTDTKNRLDLLTQALIQYDKIVKKGVSYTLNKIEVTGETHFDMQNTFIKELQTQVNSVKVHGSKNNDAIDKQWREGVGGAQRIFTADLVDYYCGSVPFRPVPDFTYRPQSTKQFKNLCKKGSLECWYSNDSRLGFDFAIFKGALGDARGFDERLQEALRVDLHVMKELCKAKTEYVGSFRAQLENLMTENLMTVDKQSQVFQKK